MSNGHAYAGEPKVVNRVFEHRVDSWPTRKQGHR